MTGFEEFRNDIWPNLGSILKELLSEFINTIKYFFVWMGENQTSLGELYIQIIRWFMPVLALAIVFSVIKRMIKVKNPRETWGYLTSPSLGRFKINHWECTVGRAKHCDITVKFATVSKTHFALIRNDEGHWFIHNLSDKNITKLNGKTVEKKTEINFGDIIDIGGAELQFEPITKQEHEIQKKKRMLVDKPIQPWTSFIMLSAFQFLTTIELILTRPESKDTIMLCYFILFSIMWAYVFITRAAGQRGFEPEILAFFACTLNLAVTATSSPGTMLKQTLAIAIGMVLFIMLGYYLRDLERVVKTRHIMAVFTILLFLFNIIFGQLQYGARNWVNLFGVSVQPSEIAKICFIFAGAATLDRLFVKRNLFGFMCLSGFCMLALAITGDFGTAAIFFIVFLVIAYMRSGDFATLSLICGAAAGAIIMIIRFKPYIASRFAVWGHAWENASTSGYQQVRTMSASASGGMIGVGAGNGWLHNVAASNTDLVLGIICEEWGLIIALLTVAIIITLSIFAFRVVQTGRSSYYTIAACAVTSLFVFQTILNVFGSLDILPLTGVTFPFISCGGTSMVASWGLLSFLKAADTRQNASFAVKKRIKLGNTFEDPLEEILKVPAKNNKMQKKTLNSKKSKVSDDTMRIDKQKKSYMSSPSSGSQGDSRQRRAAKDSDYDEMDAFFRQFDDMDSDNDKKRNNDDEIEYFLNQFNNITPPSEDNERRHR